MTMISLLTNTLVGAVVALSSQQGELDPPQIEVWLNDRGQYEQGDRMRVYFRTDRDAFVTVMRISTLGHVRILFPAQPWINNYVAGGERYEATADREGDYRIHDDPGHGYVFAVVSGVPFNYENFANRGVWDYHLISFQDEEARDPYDTFAHFMNDIVAPDSRGTFTYQAASYSVDERGSRYFYSTYRYYSIPHYHNCHVYRAFIGLRPYYGYSYDCGRVGVHIVLGSYGHYHYHDHYYHYGYAYGYDPYYFYGYGSSYVYRYAGGQYRHSHGVRRVTRHTGYSGLARHNGGRNDGSVTTRRRSPTGAVPGRRVVPNSPSRSGSGVRGAVRGRRSTGTARGASGSTTSSAGRRTVRSTERPPVGTPDRVRRAVPDARRRSAGTVSPNAPDRRVTPNGARRSSSPVRRALPQTNSSGSLTRRRSAPVVVTPRAPAPATRRSTGSTARPRSQPSRSAARSAPRPAPRSTARRSTGSRPSASSRPRASSTRRPTSSGSRPRSGGSRPTRSSGRRGGS